MKPTHTSPRPFALRSPDHYPAQRRKRFKDPSLVLLLLMLLGVIVALGVVLVRQ